MTGSRSTSRRRRSKPCSNAPDGGFTLLELLVAITIMALVSMLAVMGLRIIASGSAARQRDIVAWASDARALEVISEELGRALPLDWGPAGNFRAAFDGDSERIRFVNATPGYREGGGLTLWQYRLEARSDRTVIYLQRRSLGPQSGGFDDLEGAPEQPVAQVEGDLRFDYFGIVDEDDEEVGRWHVRWRDVPRLPQAVRLAGSNLDTPLLMVALHIDMPSECLGPDQGAGRACGHE